MLRDRSGRFELAIVFGIKPPHLTGGPWNFKKGNESALLEPFGMTIDDTTLDYKYYPEIGEWMNLQDRKLRVLAFTNHFRTFRGDASYMSALNAKRVNSTSPLLVNAIMIKLKGGVDRFEAKQKVAALFPFASVIETEDLAKSTINYNLETTGVGGSLYLSAALAAGIGIVIIALTLYNSILSYERDIAILRALGARKVDILIIILYQVLVMALIGIFFGLVLLSFVLNIISDTRVPVALPIWFGPVHVISTLLVCILGSLYAVRHAMKIEPVTVFR
ncbi:MAG: ABC transporter permease [Parachlamydiaceae bacterium]